MHCEQLLFVADLQHAKSTLGDQVCSSLLFLFLDFYNAKVGNCLGQNPPRTSWYVVFPGIHRVSILPATEAKKALGPLCCGPSASSAARKPNERDSVDGFLGNLQRCAKCTYWLGVVIDSYSLWVFICGLEV